MGRTIVNEPRVHPQFSGTSTIFLYEVNSLGRQKELRDFLLRLIPQSCATALVYRGKTIWSLANREPRGRRIQEAGRREARRSLHGICHSV